MCGRFIAECYGDHGHGGGGGGGQSEGGGELLQLQCNKALADLMGS